MTGAGQGGSERPLGPSRPRPTFGVVLLCAGASPSGGRPKGALPHLGRSLVVHAARTALASGASEVVVVLGDGASELRPLLTGLGVRIVTNRAWAEGIGSSVRAGIAALSPDLDGAVVTLGDRTRITPAHLRALAEGLGEAPIVASQYDGVLGAPCAFARSEFPRLLALPGHQGARAILRDAAERVAQQIATIVFAAANVRIDLPEGRTVIVPAPLGRTPLRSIAARDSRAPPRAYAPA